MTVLDLLLLGAVGASFWLLILRPARTRREAQRALMASLQPGQRIMTTAGLFATVVTIEAGLLRAQVAPGVVVEMVPEAVGRVLDAPPQPAHGGEAADPSTARDHAQPGPTDLDAAGDDAAPREADRA